MTNEEYGRYLQARPDAPKPGLWNDRQYNQSHQPVVGVAWDEARAYCEWAGLVLPTEAQWEFACRAGTKTRYYSGDGEEDLAKVGWYEANSEERLHPVGEKPANQFGLHDMHGNVIEWCRDVFDAGFYSKPESTRKNPVCESGSEYRVVRGGSWFYFAGYCRSAYRGRDHPSFRDGGLGFRPSRSSP